MADLREEARLSKFLTRKAARRRPTARDRRRGFLERLEERHMLTGPELFAIRPDELALLNNGDVLHVAPREFNLLFKGGADIQESTILNLATPADDKSIRLVRSGNDGLLNTPDDVVVDLGNLGLNDPLATDAGNLQQIVLRPASSAAHNDTRPQASLPDDLYQIQIFGGGAAPLKNRSGQAFSSGTNFTQTFRLDRGAQVIAVVPQPVARNTHRIALTGGALTGSFTLTVLGQTSTPIVIPATAMDVQNALEALPGNVIRPNDVIVAGNGLGPWDVTFQGQYAAEQSPALTANGAGLNTGGVTVNRLASLSQANNQVVVYFDDQDLNPADAGDPKFYRLLNTQASLGSADDVMLLPQQVTYDKAANRAALTFASIPDGTYRLEIGVSDEVSDTIADALRVGTLFSKTGFDFEYVGFVGDQNGASNNQADVDLFRINVAAGTQLNIMAGSKVAGFDPSIRLLNPNGTPIAPDGSTEGGSGGQDTQVFNSIGGIGFVDLIVEVSSEGGAGGTGDYLLQMDSIGSNISASDANTTFTGATQLGSLGLAGISHASQITAQSIGMPEFPGSVDEPGHRDIQGEQHISDDIGITNFSESVVPNVTGIRQVRYYFGSIYGTDSFGNNLTNQITDGQKQLARQIFEIYSSQLGIQFVEITTDPGVGSSNDLQVVTGSIAAVTNATVAGTYGYTKRLSHLVSLMDAGQFASDDKYGGPWFAEAVRQIGQAIGGDSTPWLVHSYDLLSSQGPGLSVPASSARFPGDPAYAGPVGEPVFPGDNDLVHEKREARPDSTDIDLYRFTLDQSGTFVGEISAQRTGSLLNSVLTLFDVNGRVIAQNDDYFSKDSYLELDLEPGTYFVGVTSVGNANYNPSVPDSGFGGTTDGAYQLNLSFKSNAVSHLRDTTDVSFDGDSDGKPGGEFQFWFKSSDDTIFVDKANDQRANLVDGDGMIIGPAGDPTRGPYDNLEFALRQAGNRIVAPLPSAIQDGEKFDVTANNVLVTFEFNKVGGPPANGVDISAATTADDVATAIQAALVIPPALAGMTVTRNGNVVMLDGIQSLNVKQSHGLLTSPNLVRIVGNGGLDQDIRTLGDNAPYLLGLDNSNNPTADGAEFLVPQGTTVMVDSGALFKMRRANLAAGSSSTGIDRSAGAIQVLGVPGRPVYFRSLRDDTVGGDSDGVGPAATGGDYGGIVFRSDSDLEDDGIFLNWVNHADLDRGGGKVPVESREEVFAPIHMVDARPTVSFNRITQSAGAALSANPNSFSDDGGRIGPDIHSNTLFAIDAATGTVLDNSINGLFIRIETLAGNPVDKLTKNARFDDDDIVHVITENLQVVGNPGGTFDGKERLSGRLRVDAGVVVKLDDARIELERGASSLIAEGTVNDPVIFTSVKDDRFGGSGIFDTDRGNTSAKQGDWGGLIFNAVSSASIDHALITFAGGQTPLEGNFSVFNAIEVHQARLRLTNSILEKNASGRATDDRNGRGTNKDAVIFVRGAQPIIVNNIIRNNNLDRLGSAAPTNVISINANALNSDSLQDYGRSTGVSERFDQIADNHGPLVRLNRIANNGRNGMDVRGAYLTTESVWDDTDIVHVVLDEIMVGNHHTFSGLRLQSSNTESLVVKFSGANAGFTATGRELDIDDRIGGTVQILGTPGHPVILTSLADDTTGSGFSPTGSPVLDTNNDGIFGVNAGAASPAAGNWRSVRLDKLSNDRNVAVANELENPFTDANDTNARTSSAEQLGQLAPNQKSGDENRRLGFEVHGIISPDDPADDDIYSFQAEGGTRVWLDLDRTASDLDARLELIDINGTVLATSSSRTVLSGTAQTMRQNTLLGGDYYSLNRNDPGMSVVLSGSGTGTYFVRVRADGPTIVDSNTLSVQFLNNDPAPSSITISSGDFLVQGFAAGQRLAVRGSGRNNGDYLISTVTANTITLDVNERLITESAPTGTKLRSNLTSGAYQLQVRLQQRDEKPGSAIRYADIRYATTGIEVRGLPYHSNLLGEVAEVDGGDVGNTAGSAFNIGNVLATDRASISIGGEISTSTDVDWYEFTLDHALIENATENSSGQKTVALVFDVDYADGLSKPDTTVAVYDSANRLIYIGRESNVADDQDTTVGDPSADLSRGSAGKLDPYIGPIHLPVGFVNGASQTYRMAIMSNRNTPNAIMGFYLAGGGQADLRLEPANGVRRIVEDHIGTGANVSSGYLSGTFTHDTISDIENRFEVSPQFTTVSPVTSQIFNTSNTTTLTTYVKPFTLADIRLYVSTEEDLFSVDPFNGNDRIRVGEAPDEVEDIVFRSDGRLYGYQRRDVDQTDGDGAFGNEVANTAGELLELSAGDGSILGRTDDGVRGPILTTSNPVVPGNYRHDITYTDQVDAVTFRRTPPTSSLPQAPQYDIYYSVRDPNVPSGSASKLFIDDSPTDVADGVVPDVTAGDTTNNNGGLIGYIGATKSFAFVTMNNAVIGFFPNDVGPAGDGISVNITQSAADPGTNPVVIASCTPTIINVTIRNNAGNATASAQTVVDVINAACDGSPGFAAVMDGDGGNNVANTTTTVVGDRTMTTAGGTRTLRGITTGLAFVDTDADGDGDNLFGVTNQGEFFRINTITATNTFFPTASVTVLADLGAGVNFQGLAIGPQNVRDLGGSTPGFYRQMVFAIDTSGTLRAFDTTKAALAPNVPLESVFSGGTTQSVPISPLSGGVTGLAFSPLDFNLWHPTQKRGTEAGHGLLPSPDNERNPGQRVVNFGPNSTSDAEGNQSFQFALEEFDENITSGDFKYQTYGGASQGSTAQLGVATNIYHNDLTSTAAIGDNYNLPGGALGSLVSGTFSLASYSSSDKPTLYFNYWLQSENAAGGPHEFNPLAVTPQDRSMRDSARVFISNDGVTWEMLATNNSTLSLEQKNGDDEAELSSFISHNSIANFTGGDTSADGRRIVEQQVQELFDVSDWRQARVDLHKYAGLNNLRLRFDFSTAGSMDETNIIPDCTTVSSAQKLPGDCFGAFEDSVTTNDSTARQRGQNNAFEGFYVDDIIIGLTERGEMVTGATADPSIFDLESNGRTRFPDPTAPARDLTGNYQVEIRRAGEYASIITGLRDDLIMKSGFPYDSNDRFVMETGTRQAPGDKNVEREQGQLIIDSNVITNSQTYGIDVAAGSRNPASNRPRPGSLIRFDKENTDLLYPGAVIQNNVVAFGGQGGIRFAGDAASPANAPVPFGKIVNNTIVGGNTINVNARSGVGVSVESNASPTLLNNIFANTTTAIQAAGTSPVIGSNLFHNNGSPTQPTDLLAGSNPLFQVAGDPLFVNTLTKNFYLQAGALAIDSSLDSLQDRITFANFKAELGVPQSPIFAPSRDVFGQLRVDDPNEDPLGGGASIFKDRGAVDRADKEQPYATLILPIDNDTEGLDLDANSTIVHRADEFLEFFSILLGDGLGPNSPFQGTGVNGLTVDNPADPLVSQRAVKLSRNGGLLVEGVDYNLGYNANNNVLLLTPLSSLWEPQSVYVITLDNTQIADLAGNSLRNNQPDGSTTFTILLGDFAFDYGDAPNSFGTLQASNGVRHVLIPGNSIFLGSRVDGDADGTPTALADGDDREQAVGLGTSTLSLVSRPPFQVQLPANGAGLNDNDSFIVSDGTNAVTFQFDLGANGVAVGNVAIPYFNLDGTNLLADRMVQTIRQQVTAGALVGITATAQGAGVISVAGGANANLNVLGAGGRIALSNRLPIAVRVPAAGGGQIADQMTFTVNDGVNPPVTFEFDSSLAVGLSNPTYIPVPFTGGGGYNPNNIATALAAAVNAQAGPGKPLSNLNATAASVLVTSPDTVAIVNKSNNVEDDEDGVTIGKIFAQNSFGIGYTTPVTVVASATGRLDAWIDFNRNSIFETTERVYNAVDLVAGVNTLSPIDVNVFAAGVSVISGDSYARFRFSASGGLSPTGLGVGGEVEDHFLRILSNADPFAGNPFANFIDTLPGDQGLTAGVLDVLEDQLHDAVSPGVDFAINLTNVNGGVDGSPGDVYSDDLFDDIDLDNGNGDALTYSIVSNSNTAVVTVALVGTTLNLDFLPNRNDQFGGQAKIVVRATDHARRTRDETLTISVKPVNDAPVLVPISPSLSPITNEDTTSTRYSVSGIVGASITDPDLAVPAFTPLKGIAITGTTGNGVWQYTLDGGATFNPVGVVSANSALLLRSSDELRYVPDSSNGETPTLTYRAWDQTGATANQQGTKVDPTVIGTGGTNPFSVALDTATLSVTSVNDAPVLNPIAPNLPGVSEDIANTDFTVASMVGASISDVDAGAVQGIAITAKVGNGQWFYSITGGATFVQIPTLVANQGLLLRAADMLRYVPDQKNGEVATLSYYAWDQSNIILNPAGSSVDVSTRGGTSSYSAAGDVAQLAVAAANDAPVLVPIAPNLPTTNEDTATTGAAVNSFLGASITDVDNLAVQGIAITSTAGNGTWEFSINGGGTYNPIGAVSAGSALLLRPADLVRYVPDQKNGETATLSYRAWDQTAGATGTKVSTTPNGTTTPFSVANDVLSLVVTSVNDSPVLTPAGSTLPPGTLAGAFGTDEDTTTPGMAVAAILGASNADVDNGALSGIAIVATVGNGRWEYSTNGGVSFAPVGTVSTTQALLIRGTDQLRYVPDLKNTEVATVTYRSWDQSGATAGQQGTKQNATDTGVTDPYSAALDTVTLNVAGLNDAPVLTPIGPSLSSVDEETPTANYQIVNLIGASITDVDVGAVQGIAITTATGRGTWEYSLNGVNFLPVGAVSQTSARALRPQDWIRYIPDTKNGEIATISYRGWDQTGATAGGQGNTFDASVNGNTTPFSAVQDTIAVDISPLNDAPILTPAAPVLTATNEDTTSAGDTVSTILAASVLDVDDLAAKGIAITATTGNGTWEYSINGGTSFQAVGAVTSTSALLLRAADIVRYSPDRINGETPTITYRAWDQTGATAGLQGTKVNPAPTGGTSAFSINSDTGSLVVASINDGPSIVGPASASVEEDERLGALVFSAANLNQIVIADVDAQIAAPDSVNGGELIVTLQVLHGSLTMPSMVGLTAIDADGSDGTLSFKGLQGAITTAMNGLTYHPAQHYNVNLGPEALTITVNDQGGTGAEPVGFGPTQVAIPITVSPVNDQPVLSATTVAFSLNEGLTPLALNTIAIGGLLVTDQDEQETLAPNNTLQVTLTVAADNDTNNGSLTVTASGLAGVAGNGTGVVTVTGTEGDVNATLATLIYKVPNSDFNKLNNADAIRPSGDVLIAVTASDLGHSGFGGALAAVPRTVTITVEPINDAPLLNVTTSSFQMNEGSSPASLNTRVLTGISVTDVDEQESLSPNNTLQVTVTVLPDNDLLNGTLSVTLAGTATAVGNGQRILTLTGTEGDVNASLVTLTYRVPNDDFNKVNNVDGTNASGNAFVSIAVSDLGHSGSGPAQTAPVQTVTLTVEPLNDTPSFNLTQTTVAVNEDIVTAPALAVVAGVANNIAPWTNATATDENGQALDFLVDVTSPSGNIVFEVAPDIDPTTGNLTFRTAKDTNGSAVLEVRLRDVTTPAIGGTDLTTLVQRVTLNITAVNDVPEFTPTATGGANVTVDEDAGLTVVSNWATGIRPGPATATDEVGQALEFVVTSDNPTLFSIAPTVDAATGALQFRAADNANGTANIAVSLRETGNPASVSQAVNRVITVREVNDVPVAASHVYATQEDGGSTNNLPAAAPFDILVTDLTTTAGTKDSPGPANESTQILTLVATSVGPTSAQGGTVVLSSDGTRIHFTPRVNFFGTDTFTYEVSDDGTSRGLNDPQRVTGTITINISAVNDAPIAVNDPPLASLASYTTDENDVLVVAGVGVIFNDIDESPSSLVIEALDTTTLNTRGSVQFLPDASNALRGDFRYTPGTQFDSLAQGQTATDRFLYQIRDNGGLTSAFATVTVTVRGLNDAPITSPISLTTTEDATLANQLFVGSDMDVEPAPQALTYTIVNSVPAGQGTVINHGNGSFTFNPGSAFQDLQSGDSRTVQFTYRATDQRGANSNLSVVNILVMGANDAPNAAAGSFVASEDGTTAGFFPASDADDSPSSLTYRIVSQPSSGTVAIGAGNAFTFNANGAFDGLQAGQTRQVTFVYGAKDPHDAESTGTVTVTVTGVNDNPTASPLLLNIAEDGGSVTGNFVGNDADDDDDAATLTYLIATNVPAGQGTLINNNNGTVSYLIGSAFQDLSVGQTRDVTFGYRSRDRHGALSDIATATIRVTGTNDAPVAPTLSVSTGENSSRVITFAGTDVDSGETAGLTYSLLGGLGVGQGSLGAVVGNTVTFTPGTDFDRLPSGQSQQLTFSYQAKDVNDAFSIPGTVTITVSGENDAPTAGSVSLAATENGPRVTVALAGDDVDSNDDPDTLTYQLLTVPPAGQGTVVLTGTRSIEFNPGADFQNLGAGQTQQVTLTYRTKDRFGLDSVAAGTVTITVTGQNDAPVVSNLAAISAVEDGPTVNGTLVGFDPDTTDQALGLLFVVVTQPSEGSVATSGVRGNNAFSFDPGTGFQNLATGQTRSVTFGYQASDSGNVFGNVATGTVIVTGTNDAPVAQNVTGVNAQEDGGAVAGSFTATDPDSDETGNGLVYLLATPPSEGTVNVNGAAGNRQFSFDPGTGFQDLGVGQTRQVTFTYQVRDTHGLVGVSATVTVTVSGRNDAPVAAPVTASGSTDNGPINGQFAATDLDSDENGSGLTYVIVSPPASGSVSTSGAPGDRNFAFDASTGFADLAVGESRQVTFTYKAHDTHGSESTPQTVMVTVTGVNDAPVASPVSGAAIEDGSPVTVTLAGDDVDSDDSPNTLVYALIGQLPAGQGTLTDNGNGTVTYNPGSAFQSLSVGEAASVTFTYTATDRHGVVSSAATGTIVVTGVNDAPLTSTTTAATTENADLTQPFAATDLDPDSEDSTASLQYTIVTPPPTGQGTVTVNQGGTFTFALGNDFDGLAVGETRNVTFTFRATDRRGASSGVATATVTVTGQNDAPVSLPVNLEASEHGANVIGTYNADDRDSDDTGATLTYAILDTVLTTSINQQTRTVGTLTNNTNGTFTFQPDPNFRELGAGQALTLPARYRATDRHGSQSSVSTLTITLTGVNDAPTARNDFAATMEDVLLVVDAPGVLGAANDQNRDSDPDQGDALTVVAFDSVSALGAAVTVSGTGSYRYDPRNAVALNELAAGMTIEDTFRYTIQDNSGVQSLATVTVTVTGANDSPIAGNDTYPANADEAASIVAPGVLINDSDPDGNVLTVLVANTTSARGATVELQGDGSFQYFPGNVPAFRALRAGEPLQDTFTYSASDGAGGTAQATVTMNVVGVNDAPVVVSDSYTASEDNLLSVSRTSGLLRNDSDSDGDTLTAQLVAGPTHGTLVTLNADGSFSYRPNQNFNGTDTFTYRANDGALNSADATVTISVSAVGDAPIATNDAYSGVQATTLVVSAANGVLKNDTSVDSPTLTATLVRAPANGVLTLNTDGSLSYNPAASFAGQDTFTYRASDPAGSVSNVATVTITIASNNPWQNPQNQFDANNDGSVSPIDVLVLINDLNSFGARALPVPPVAPFIPPPFLDVNGDGSITPQDALTVINLLNAGGSEGEGESGEFVAVGLLMPSPTLPPLQLGSFPVTFSARIPDRQTAPREDGTIPLAPASNAREALDPSSGGTAAGVSEESWEDLLAVLSKSGAQDGSLADQALAELFGRE